jgi:hypothetical protein
MSKRFGCRFVIEAQWKSCCAQIVIAVAFGRVGNLQFLRRALEHVLEWYVLHRDELAENWELARNRRPLRAIAPLE